MNVISKQSAASSKNIRTAHGSLLAVVLTALLSGCSALGDGENRKVTAWGVWCTPAACGVGYWHSERGPDVEGEISAQPPMTLNTPAR